MCEPVSDASGPAGMCSNDRVPTMASRVLDHPSLPKRNLSGVRSISLGGAAVQPELTARLRIAFTGAGRGLSTIYGMTETGSGVVPVELEREGPKSPPSSSRGSIEPDPVVAGAFGQLAQLIVTFASLGLDRTIGRGSQAWIATEQESIAIAAGAPAALVSVATLRITAISIAVITISTITARPTAIVGTVAPRLAGLR